MIIGGIYLFALFFQEKYDQIISLMLIFYGLAIINGSKYTFKGVTPLGYIQVSLGLLCIFFTGFEFWFWGIGFGLVHIVYGGVMYFKYGK